MEGNRKALRALSIHQNLDSYLSACQLGITLASLGLGWVAELAERMPKAGESFSDGDLTYTVLKATAFIVEKVKIVRGTPAGGA